MGYVWYEQSIGDVKCFQSMVKQRLEDVSRQEWHAKKERYCPAYLDYNSYSFTAKYIDIVQSHKERRVFSLLRTQ